MSSVIQMGMTYIWDFAWGIMKGLGLWTAGLKDAYRKWKWKSLSRVWLCDPISPGQNAGVGSYSLLQENLPNPGIEPRAPALQADSLAVEPPKTTS